MWVALGKVSSIHGRDLGVEIFADGAFLFQLGRACRDFEQQMLRSVPTTANRPAS